jgi:Zn-dependent peptidase ImmA (M78 family)/transcriptional regulator with XRE-family HTH domain
MEGPVFTPTRLTLARKRRGLKKSELAGLSTVTARTITAYERGLTEPQPSVVEVLARALDFPASFFYEADLEEPPVNGVSFRALTRMTASQRDTALAAGTLAIELEGWLATRFELPETDIPELDRQVVHPESAASIVRTHWGIGEAPVANMIHLLEAHGVRVFSLVQACREVDAFSFWSGTTPFVCLNTVKTAEHSRFDAAHELGHLVLHRGRGSPRGRQEEREADAFASALLMPRADLLAAAPRFPGLSDLVVAKKRWKVSAAALSYRMHKLGVLTDWHYRELCIELARFGRSREPDPSTSEHSQLLEKVFATLRAEGVARADVAAALHVTPAELDSLVFGLVVSLVEGGGDAGPTADRRAGLRLILSPGRNSNGS